MKPLMREKLRVEVTPRSVLKRMSKRISEKKWLGTISRVCENYAPKIQPVGVYKPVLCTPNSRAVELTGDFRFESGFLADLLPSQQLGAVFLVTIGAELEASIQQEIERGHNLKAFILDCLGSNAAEAAAAAIHREAEQGLRRKMRRYSPGYNDWHISQQRVLFQFLGRRNVSEVGVELTPDFMMSPRKSVSGIILPRVERKQIA